MVNKNAGMERLADGRRWNGLAYVHDTFVQGCDCASCTGVKTPIGELRCEVHADKDYPGLTLYWGERQIAVVEPDPQGNMRVMVWADDHESPSDVVFAFPGYGEVKS